ncbi:hypothetical protein LI063_03355 [Clostridium perfringens]|uniref:hypothetical protein n=1 Tax=Clostridium perfringens TaxID=1502 RepID=UPI001FABCE89|nr:hypothetical protein [Clostridium perfringens]MCX0363201.1 hypothetical protein [Clostridium perfringens]
MKPRSRIEQYLNAVATGDTKDLPSKPQSRIEKYLELILNKSSNDSDSKQEEEITLTGGFKINVERIGNIVILNIYNAATNGQLSGEGNLPVWALPSKTLGGALSASGPNFNGVLNIIENGKIYYYVATATKEVGVYCGQLVYFTGK